MASTITQNETTILSRIIKPNEATLPASAARALLELDFDDSDRRRMHELVLKNQEGALTSDEQDELEAYVHIGLVLDVLRAKARLSLKRTRFRR
jgi:hypothetical protein